MSSTVPTQAKLRSELFKLDSSTGCMPLMVRLAWHDACTGGANGSIRFAFDLSPAVYYKLNIAHDLLAPIKAGNPDVSFADLYQLAAVVGIEEADGPRIPFRLGRIDATEEECTTGGRLENTFKRTMHLREMGFSDAEIVTLSGAQVFSNSQRYRTEFRGPWKGHGIVFDNPYYEELIKGTETVGALLLDDKPELKKQVEKYAEKDMAFFEDYAWAHVTLSELGMKSVPVFMLTPDADKYVIYGSGVIEIPPKRVVDVFGDPGEPDHDDYRVSGEYAFSDVNGNVITLYDYKMTSAYNPEYFSPPQFWSNANPAILNIGGSRSDVAAFKTWLREQTEYEERY